MAIPHMTLWVRGAKKESASKTEENRESIRDATAELQVKIIWSRFINK
jgi:hypothetical protein